MFAGETLAKVCTQIIQLMSAPVRCYKSVPADMDTDLDRVGAFVNQ